jgi:lysyl-tRNA synthetase class 2
MRHGRDSLARFVLRPDKSFHFAWGGMVAYRVIGRTAVVSGDPIAPAGMEGRVLSSFVDLARHRQWKIVVWGASEAQLAHYRALGLRWKCAGEEAFVTPAHFTLEGRHVRKLRQSVQRVRRRGWVVEVFRGDELDFTRRLEIDGFERSWRAEQARLLGFAMGFGGFDPDVEDEDLYLLGRSPETELRAVMRFVGHCGRLSLDTMHRVGETPNGLNEALVCTALEWARAHGVPEVSLNYAGLGHLVRREHDGRAATLTRAGLDLLSRRFQMERLVRFNEKFLPEWRPRFIVYQSRRGLPGAVVRVLQAEGHLSEPLIHSLRRVSPPSDAAG